MNISIGSLNLVKIKAVKLAYEQYYDDFTIVEANVDSGVSDQPIGLDKILEGALNRARGAFYFLKEKIKDKSPVYGVGIEAGLVKISLAPTNYMDFQFCVIIDEKKKISLGSGIAFEYPDFVIEKVFSEKKEIGYIMGNLANNKNLKKEAGAIGFLSKNRIKRIDILKEAVICALLPRINSTLYES